MSLDAWIESRKSALDRRVDIYESQMIRPPMYWDCLEMRLMLRMIERARSSAKSCLTQSDMDEALQTILDESEKGK